MRGKVWQVAPWCLCAVLFFCGADQGPKPIPEYMRLLLLEEQYQSARIALSTNQIKSAIMLASDSGTPGRYAAENIRCSLAALDLELQMAPLRERYAGVDSVTVTEFPKDRTRVRKELQKMKSDRGLDFEE